MAVSQIIIFMDSTGALRAEMPGEHGSRRKLDLSPNFAKKNPELIRVLRDDQDRQRHQAAQIAEIRSREREAAHTDADADLAKRRTHLADQERARREWLETLPASRREVEEHKLAAKIEKAVEAANARARGLYHYVATAHGIRLAERVIDDPKRRPRKRIMVATAQGMKEMSPRAGIDKTIVDLSLAIDI